MNTEKTLPVVYAELVAEEARLAAAVESVNQRTNYRQLFVARGELATLREVMATFADDEKVEPPPVDWVAFKRDRRREEMEELTRTLPAEIEQAERRANYCEGEYKRLAARPYGGPSADQNIEVARLTAFNAGREAEKLRARLDGAYASLRRLEEEAQPGYAMFETDAARKQYLSGVVATVRSNFVRGLQRETRGREIEGRGRLGELRRSIEANSKRPDWMTQPAATPAPSPAPTPPGPDDLEELLRDVPDADPPDTDAPEWEEFSDDSGTLKVPRASMPQIKSEHRGAMVQFLKGRGITHKQETVEADSLKPSQAEYSPAKVEKARGFEGPERSILVSSDDHVLDGHHQWLSKLGKPIPVIRLDAPIHQLLIEVARFPSSGVDETSNKG